MTGHQPGAGLRLVDETSTARRLSASEFKARCLAILESVRSQGREFMITKRGEPIARVIPVRPPAQSLRGAWRGRLEILGDIVQCDWSEEFEVSKE